MCARAQTHTQNPGVREFPRENLLGKNLLVGFGLFSPHSSEAFWSQALLSDVSTSGMSAVLATLGWMQILRIMSPYLKKTHCRWDK